MQKLHIQTMVAIVMFMYMAAVNIMIVKYMYKRYELKNKMARLAFDREPVPVEVRRVPETVQSTPQTTTCDESRSLGLVIAFVDETSSVQYTNDVAHTNQNLHVLRKFVDWYSQHHKVKVLLFVSPDTFLSLHRSWCRTLYMHVGERASCELVFETEITRESILTGIRQEHDCFRGIAMLHNAHQFGSLASISKLNGLERACIDLKSSKRHRGPKATKNGFSSCAYDSEYVPREKIDL